MGKREACGLEVFRQIEIQVRQVSADSAQSALFHPRADVFETRDAVVVKMELAGVRREEIRITVSEEDGCITVAGCREEPRNELRLRTQCYQLEIYYGPFERTVPIPAAVSISRESIAATYSDGLLYVSLPKRAPSGS
jgi:HSP20 family protein